MRSWGARFVLPVTWHVCRGADRNSTAKSELLSWGVLCLIGDEGTRHDKKGFVWGCTDYSRVTRYWCEGVGKISFTSITGNVQMKS